MKENIKEPIFISNDISDYGVISFDKGRNYKKKEKQLLFV
jgi:hypothetical protein